MYDEGQKHLQEMIDEGAIRPCNSAWASAVVLVRKKKDELCFYIDLWKLNSLMVKDAFSIARIQDTMDCLQGAVWFTLLDFKSKYWQVKLEEASKALIAFTVAPSGSMSVSRSKFSAMFQYLMETCFGNLRFQWCIIYLEDVLVLAAASKEHIKRLHAVLTQRREAGLKLQPAKYEFF